MRTGRNLKLTKKLMLGIGIILFITFSAISLFFYYYVKHLYLKETYRQTELLFSYINATVEYVEDELRPKMFHVLPKDEFIQEAVSTAFVTRGITKRFVKRFPEYNYRRVAIDPRNSENMANEKEARKSLLERFNVKYIKELLNEYGGNVSLAARIAGLERQSLQHLMRRYGIHPEEIRKSANKI